MAKHNQDNSYSPTIKKKIWAKALPIQGHPPDIWRRDKMGNVIHWQEYGNIDSVYGWKILSSSFENNSTTETAHLHPVHYSVNLI